MTSTTVGMRCPECAKQRTRVVAMRGMTSVPRVTYALMAINVIVYLAEGNLGLGAPSNTVFTHGALLGSGSPEFLPGQGVAHGQWWRIVSSGFLHENIVHLGLNMWVLYLLGQMIEPALGPIKYVAVYAVSLLAGSLGALLLAPHALTVGASGAIFGLMGAAAVEARSRHISLAQSGLGGLILINLVFSFTFSGISLGGHIGGLIGGVLAALAIQLGDRRRSLVLALTACALIGAAAIAGSVITSRSSDAGDASVAPALLTPGG